LTDMARIWKSLGPIIISIQQMFAQTTGFMLILFIFGAGFTLAFVVIAGDAEGLPSSPALVMSVLGQLDKEFLPQVRPVVGTALMVLYLLVMEILLINLLIAIFGEAFGQVTENSNLEWKFASFEIIQEWKHRCFIPPPFTIPSAIVEILTSRNRRVRLNRAQSRSVREYLQHRSFSRMFKISIILDYITRLKSFGRGVIMTTTATKIEKLARITKVRKISRNAMEEYIKTQEQDLKLHVTEQAKEISSTVRTLEGRIEEISEKIEEKEAKQQRLNQDIIKTNEELEKKVDSFNEMLVEILQSLEAIQTKI